MEIMEITSPRQLGLPTLCYDIFRKTAKDGTRKGFVVVPVIFDINIFMQVVSLGGTAVVVG